MHWSPWPRIARRRGRGGGVLPCRSVALVGFLGGSGFVGVCCGWFLVAFVSCVGGFPWFAGVAAFCAVVAFAGRLGSGVRCVALACSCVSAVVFRCGRGRWLRLFGCRVGVCCGLVVMGWLPARGSPVCWCSWAGVWCLRAGRRSSGVGLGRSGVVALAAGLGGLAVSLLPLPVLVAGVAGCRWRWLVRGCRRALAVRCGSAALAALVCRRARLFGLVPLRASARLVLLPGARVAPPSRLSLRFGGPPALSAPPALPGLPLPVLPRGGRSASPARRPSPVSLRQGQLF